MYSAYPLIVTPSLVVTCGLIHFGKSDILSAKGPSFCTTVVLQLGPVWSDTADTRELGFAIHCKNRELSKVPLARSVSGLGLNGIFR